jgi:outer membrane protein assembly factor BamE
MGFWGNGGAGAAGWPLQCPDDIGLPSTMTASSTFRLSLLGLTLLAGLSGCSVTRSVTDSVSDSVTRNVNRDTFKPYVPEVVQGNFVSREQRQYLRPGMTRAQVRDVLGTPLVASVFHTDRWDYTFSIRRQGVPPQQFHLTLFFKGDVLSEIESDELPSEAEFAQRLSGPPSSGKAPTLEATDEQLRKFPANPASGAALPSAPAPLPTTYPPLEPMPR